MYSGIPRKAIASTTIFDQLLIAWNNIHLPKKAGAVVRNDTYRALPTKLIWKYLETRITAISIFNGLINFGINF